MEETAEQVTSEHRAVLTLTDDAVGRVGPGPGAGAPGVDGAGCSAGCRPEGPVQDGRAQRAAANPGTRCGRCRPIVRRRRSPGVPPPACQHFDPLGSKDRIERGGELRVPITDQKPEPADAIVEAPEQAAGLLRHRLPDGMRCYPEHVDLASSDLDHEQHIQPFEEHGVHGEEVHRQHTLGLRPEELPPGDCRPRRCRINPSTSQGGVAFGQPSACRSPTSAQDQIAKASSSNAIANRRLAGSSTASS